MSSVLDNKKKKGSPPPALPTAFYTADISEHPGEETPDTASFMQPLLEKTYDILTNEEKVEPVTILNNVELSALYSMMRINKALGINKCSSDILTKKMLTLKISTKGRGREDLVKVMGGWWNSSNIPYQPIIEEKEKKKR